MPSVGSPARQRFLDGIERESDIGILPVGRDFIDRSDDFLSICIIFDGQTEKMVLFSVKLIHRYPVAVYEYLSQKLILYPLMHAVIFTRFGHREGFVDHEKNVDGDGSFTRDKRHIHKKDCFYQQKWPNFYHYSLR